MCMQNKNYQLQAAYNKAAFLSDSEYREKYEVLKMVSKAFEEAGVIWALSCSSAMFFRGIVDDFNDFDILLWADSENVEKAKKVLVACGVVLNENTPQKNKHFASPYYQQANAGKVEFDIIADISVKTFGGLYTYKVEQGVEMNSLDGNICLPLAPIEAQMLLYGMMEGWQAKRRFKRELCYEYLCAMKEIQKNLRYKHILEEALEQKIPTDLKEVVSSLL